MLSFWGVQNWRNRLKSNIDITPQHLSAPVYHQHSILKRVKQFIVKPLEELFVHHWDVSHISCSEVFESNPETIPPDRPTSFTPCVSQPRMALISLWAGHGYGRTTWRLEKSLKSDSWQQATKLREPPQHHKHVADPHSNSVSKFLMARNRTSRVNLTMRQEPAMFSNSASNSPTCKYLCWKVLFFLW